MLKFRTMRGVPEERGEADADWAQQQLNGAGQANADGACTEDDAHVAPGKLHAPALDRRAAAALQRPRGRHVAHRSAARARPLRPAVRVETSIATAIATASSPGITGWAQVNGLRGKTSLSDRVEWDNYYIENLSLWLDAKIMLMTFAAVFTGFKTVD